jgi:hypothetical protein
VLSHVRLHAILLAAFCCVEPLFLVGISFVIYANFFQGCNYGIKEGLDGMPFS